MVAAQTAFWDASAIAPLCMREPSTQQARAWMRQYPPVVWWATAVEVYGAIARSRRAGSVDSGEAQQAIVALEKIQSAWHQILPDAEIKSRACALLDRHPLRAADAFQLAAAFTWCRDRPAGRNFLCGDKRLGDAAAASGFSVILLG